MRHAEQTENPEENLSRTRLRGGSVSLVTTEPVRRQQHLVSKGYQRNFADGSGRLSLLDARTGTVIDPHRRIKTNWRVQDFLSIPTPEGLVDDSLERDFAGHERVILNIIRSISPFGPISPEQKSALDRLAAIHLVRSHAFAEVHRRVVSDELNRSPMEIARDPRAIARFARERGRQPAPGEIEGIATGIAREFLGQPDILARGIKRGADAIPAILATSTVQIVSAHDRLPGFVLADHPVLHGKLSRGLFGFRDAGAVGDADVIVVPICRRLVAFYSRRHLENIQIVTKNGVNWVNSLLVRGALRELACHPDDALSVTRLIRDLRRYPPERFDRITIR